MNVLQHCASINRLPFDFNPQSWEYFWKANCYEYLLDYRNDTKNPLIVGETIKKPFYPYQSNESLLIVLKEELNHFGFLLESSSKDESICENGMKMFISRTRCGDYHFYRLDSNGQWSHKFGFDLPTTMIFLIKRLFYQNWLVTRISV